MTSDPATPARRRLPIWALAALFVALAWSFAIRIPLVMNARSHLDSDLAVDGLTLLELTQGRLRLHYPGTPYIGIVPALASLPQALIWGVNPETLVSGGSVLQALVIVACFILAWRCDGPRSACWSLLPLTFASAGLVWLSARITGGHLLATFMHAGLFVGLQAYLSRPSLVRAALLGGWAGLSLWVDSMAMVSLVSLGVVLFVDWWRSGRDRTAWRPLAVILLGFSMGMAPRVVGTRIDPYDSYQEQFSPVAQPQVLFEHARILIKDCLPRLASGHRLPSLRTEPPSYTIPTSRVTSRPDRSGFFDEVSVHLSIILFVASFIALSVGGDTRANLSVRVGLLLTSGLVIVGFIANRNIFNSDNYRYLVFLIVPWSLGFGRLMERLARKGTGGIVGAMLLALTFASVMTMDVARWYGRFGWIERGRPISAPFETPILDWFAANTEVDSFTGSYWDVYRISFLAGGRLKGMPYPIYPNRFPEWSRYWPDGRPHHLVIGSGRDGLEYRARAMEAGGKPLLRSRSGSIYTWP